MNFSDYQKLCQQTDLSPGRDIKDIVVPLLGLAGETGSLLTEYKKSLRDGPRYKIFNEKLKEELGDILWYIANIAEKCDLNLEDVAVNNLQKITERWRPHDAEELLPGMDLPQYDAECPVSEQLPRAFVAHITQSVENGSKTVAVTVNDCDYGQKLTDNSRTDDGYRFHDVFHLAYMGILGWSPVSRRNLGLKRRSDRIVDEVQDGGRAIVIEEAISALVFQHAEGRSFFESYSSIEYEILQIIKRMTSHLEVSNCPMSLWEKAILDGFRVWRSVIAHEGGVVTFQSGSLQYVPRQST